MTRRERMVKMLMTKFETLKESIGHKELEDLAISSVSDIMEMTRPKEEIIHCIGPNGKHRLIVDGKSSEWKNQNEICRNGNYIAATDFYMNQLPQVALLQEVDAKQFMTTSQQHLRIEKIEFVKPT